MIASRTHLPGKSRRRSIGLLAATALTCAASPVQADTSPVEGVRAAVDFSNRHLAPESAARTDTAIRPGFYLLDAVVNGTAMPEVV
jgi:hypothetical protein